MKTIVFASMLVAAMAIDIALSAVQVHLPPPDCEKVSAILGDKHLLPKLKRDIKAANISKGAFLPMFKNITESLIANISRPDNGGFTLKSIPRCLIEFIFVQVLCGPCHNAHTNTILPALTGNKCSSPKPPKSP